MGVFNAKIEKEVKNNPISEKTWGKLKQNILEQSLQGKLESMPGKWNHGLLATSLTLKKTNQGIYNKQRNTWKINEPLQELIWNRKGRYVFDRI